MCDIARCIFPLFLEMCPHPASLSGMLTMSTSILPTSNCCDEILESADNANDDMHQGALMTIMDNSYRHDP